MPSKQRGTYTALNWALRSMVLQSFGPLFHFPFGLALFYCLALVVGFAAAAETQFHLDDAVLGARSKRQKGETFLVQFPAQGPYLAGVQEKAPGAAGVVILAHVLRLVCGDLGVQEPGLAAPAGGRGEGGPAPPKGGGRAARPPPPLFSPPPQKEKSGEGGRAAVSG